jgi:hypothetical protein
MMDQCEFAELPMYIHTTAAGLMAGKSNKAGIAIEPAKVASIVPLVS